MTPLHIELMIHYYTSSAEFKRIEAPACSEYAKQLVGWGLLEDSENKVRISNSSVVASYQSTPRGKAFVEMLCNTPLPQLSFIDPRTKEVI